MQSILKNIATLGFIGYLPVAPGTWGTLTALLLVVFWQPTDAAHLVVTLVVSVIGIIAADSAERTIGQKDSGHIIIDEVAGYLVAGFYLPNTIFSCIAAFFLFRLFDILKPQPIRTVEKLLKGGFGVMADDIVAGLMTNAVIRVWMMIFSQ